MKKTAITAIIAVGIICATLSACSNNTASNGGSNSGNAATTDRVPLDSTIAAQPEKAHFTFIEHSQSTPNILGTENKEIIYISSSAEKVSFVADNRADRPTAKKINEVLTQAYDRSQNLYDSLVNNLDVYLSSENPDMSVFPWETKVDYTCKRNDGKAISVTETTDSYAAGQLTGTATYSYNFDPITGDRIKQVFYAEDDKASFDSADDTMYKKLVAKYGEETISYDNVSSSFVDVAQQCWYFTADGVQIIFNAGSIAPDEAGTLELEYSKEELPELAQKYFN